MKKIFILLTTSFFLMGCPTDENLGKYSLCIKNMSGETIFFWYSKDYTRYHYPNTILPAIIPMEQDPYSEIRGAGTGGCVGANEGQLKSWESIYSQLPDDKFTVYFFETDSYPSTQEDWELLLSNTNKIHIKNVTLEELRANNYTIFYP